MPSSKAMLSLAAKLAFFDEQALAIAEVFNTSE